MNKPLCAVPRRLSTAFTALALMGVVIGCHHDPNVQKQKYLESGKRYASESKYKEAAIQFSNALKVDRNFPEAHYQLGTVYLKMGSVMPAYAELSRTVALQPSNIQARIDLGNLLLSGKAPDRALEQANAVLAIKSDDADAFALLASVAAVKGDRTVALAQIQRALAIEPNRAAFHATLGLLQGSEPGQSGPAEEQLRKATSLDASNVMAHLALGSLLEQKGDLQGALDQQKAAVAGDPKNLTARVSLAQLYLRRGDKANAEATLQQATEDLGNTSMGGELLESYYLRTGDIDKGVSVYSALVSKHPKSVPIKLAYARLLVAKKDVPAAKSVVSGLMKSDASDPGVAVLNGILLLNDGKTNEAFDALQKAAKNSPDSVPVKLWLGRAALAKGDLSTAQQSFGDASKLNATSLEAADGLAQTAMRRRDPRLLGQVAEKAITVAPQSPVGYLWRGMSEAAQQQNDKADADFRQAIKIDPKNSGAYMELGQLRLAEKKLDVAKPLLEQALTYNPSSDRALGLLVSIDIAQKQLPKAVSRIQEQITKAPQNGKMYVQLSEVQLRAGDTNASLDAAQKAMLLSSADGTAVMAYSRAQLAHGDANKAIDGWVQWLKTHPNDASAYAILGTLQQGIGANDKAMDAYKKSLQIEPEQPVAANNLAYLMVEGGQNTDVALTYAQTARRSLPNSPSTADTLAWVYYSKGTYASARDLLEEAIKSAPDDPAIQYHLGMTYNKLSDQTNAMLHLKKAASLAPESEAGKDAQKALQKMG